MDLVYLIEFLDDIELKKYVDERIKELEEESKEVNNEYDVLGYDLDYNPKEKLPVGKNDFYMDLNCIYSGYVPRGVKVVYGICFSTDGYYHNDGKYYYIDDDSYIYDFCKFIRNEEIIDENELFDYILLFLMDYFNDKKRVININDNKITRDEMFQLLYKDNKSFYKPYNEHGLSWFKGKGNALCTEYSIMANNIMNFFGFNSMVVMGNQKLSDCDGEGHAFNIVSYVESETLLNRNFLMDYSNYVEIFDSNFKVVGETPFIGKIDSFNKEFLNDFIEKKKHLKFDDYSCVVYGDKMAIFAYDIIRDYYLDDTIVLKSINNNKRLKKDNNTFM